LEVTFFFGAAFLLLAFRIALTSAKLNPLDSCFSSATLGFVLDAISFTLISPAAGFAVATFSFLETAPGLRPLFFGCGFVLTVFGLAEGDAFALRTGLVAGLSFFTALVLAAGFLTDFEVEVEVVDFFLVIVQVC